MASTRAATRLPYAPFLSARSAGTLAFVWWPLIGLLNSVVQRAAVVACAREALGVFLAYVVARIAFAARYRWAITGRLALGAFLASASLSATFVFEALHDNAMSSRVRTAFLIAFIFSLVLSNGLLAACAAVLGAIVGSHVEDKTSESTDRAQVNVAIWVLVVGTLQAVTLVTVSRPGRPYAGSSLPVFLALVPPAALAIAAMTRIRSRRRWLAAVSTGAVPGWRLVEPSPETEGLPQLVGVGSGQPRTLVRVHDASRPFRESESQEAVALVALK
jgi:hypothetical protein